MGDGMARALGSPRLGVGWGSHGERAIIVEGGTSLVNRAPRRRGGCVVRLPTGAYILPSSLRPDDNAPRSLFAVAGASGFIGATLADSLRPAATLRGLSRSARPPRTGGYDEWRACDLFSLKDAQEALRGARRAAYLVHSMMPSARLSQGRFEDLDLICADNFARAAKREGLERIVYLGGLLPSADGEPLSRHLRSRQEVEETLAAHGVPVWTLRAGLVIGPGGSSWTMLERLVRRLPVMACPEWTRTLTQPVALADAAALLAACLLRDDVAPGTYDIGGPDVVSYQEMMQRAGQVMGLRRPMVRVPLLTIGLSRLWVSAVTGAPKALVAPLIESLVHPMVARDRRLQAALDLPGLGLDDSLRAALHTGALDTGALDTAAAPASGAGVQSRPVPEPVPTAVYRAPPELRTAPRARSVQRLVLPPGKDAQWVADEYVRWLPTWLIGRILRVTVDAQKRCDFYPPWSKRPLLQLTFSHERSTPDRVLFYVTGGALAQVGEGRGRLEFREVLGRRYVLAAVHDFEPRLPWPVYACTQALAHQAVMRAFGRHLARLALAAQ